jgi:hypothetical protein
VGGDALLMGAQVRTASAVAGSLWVAGGRLQLAGEVGRHLRAAGGQVDLASSARVAGNASVAGGEVTLRAPVKGAVQLAGSHVLVDAAIGGDAVITAEKIELGPQARIGGALRWRSANEIDRHPAAQVAGPVERLALPMPGRGPERGREGARRHGDDDDGAAQGSRGRGAGWAMSLAWTLGLAIVAAVALAVMPRASAGVAHSFVQRWPWALLIGFALLVCVPVAVVVLVITLVGAPLGLLVLLLYLLSLPLGYLAGASALGQWGLERFKPAQAAELRWRIGAALAALVALAIVGRVPFVGTLALFVLMLAGLGAIALHIGSLGRAAAATAAPKGTRDETRP